MGAAAALTGLDAKLLTAAINPVLLLHRMLVEDAVDKVGRCRLTLSIPR